jgi:palmitoyltransferase
MISRSKAANLARISLLQAVENGDLPLVHYITTRANPMSLGMRDAEGNTPLHISAKAGHVDIILYFVERGIPIDILNGLGHTPLMLAVSYGHIAACNAILKLGADVNKKDSLGFSPVIHAAQLGNVFNFHHLVSNASLDINDTDNDGHTVLCWACYGGHKELLEYILSDNCPMTPHLGILDQMNRTPMHWAAAQNSREACSFLVTCKCKLCPTEGGDNGARDGGNGGRACATGKQMLDMRDEEGKTPADCANAKGHGPLAQELEYERSGVRVTAAQPAPKKDDEKTFQFLSSFLPFVCIIFLGMPYLPFWALAVCCVAAVAMHVSGRVVHWTNKSKTLVPAGLLAASLLGMIWCLVLMHYSLFTTAVMIMGLVGFEYSYYVIMYVDPGFITPSEGFFKRVLDTVATGADPPAEYCRSCKIIKPSRSKHCRDCNACVDRFDHHCYWIANCVGKKNVRHFYLLLLYCITLLVSFEYLGIMFLWEQCITDGRATTFLAGLQYAYTSHPQVLWLTCFLVIVAFPFGALTTLHTKLIATDSTTYEMMTKFSRSPGFAPKKFSPMRVLELVQHGGVIFQSHPNNEGALAV